MSTNALKAWWSRNGSTVMFIGAQVCAIVAPILSAKAQPKATAAVEAYKAEHMQKYIEEGNDPDLKDYIPPTKIELAKAGCYNAYIPAAGVTLGGIALGSMAHSTQQKQIVAWSNAYNALSTSTQYLQDAVKENVSKEKFDKIKSEAAKKECADVDPKTLPSKTDDPSKLSWFKDEWSGQVFRSNIETIRMVRNDINEILNNEGRVPLNEWFVHLQNAGCGVSLVELGWAVGWEATVPYQNLEVDIDVTQLEDGTPCGLLTFRPKPRRF